MKANDKLCKEFSVIAEELLSSISTDTAQIMRNTNTLEQQLTVVKGMLDKTEVVQAKLAQVESFRVKMEERKITYK